jgi:hypothetical protein
MPTVMNLLMPISIPNFKRCLCTGEALDEILSSEKHTCLNTIISTSGKIDWEVLMT